MESVSRPRLVVADAQGALFDVPELQTMVRSGGALSPATEDFAPLPQGSLLFHLPGRRAIGWDPRARRARVVRRLAGREVFATATFLPPAHTHLLLAAWRREADAPTLPLYAYCALGFAEGAFVAPAVRTDPDPRQDVVLFDEDEIARAAPRVLGRFKGNRLAAHLVHNCALRYCCPAARNFVLGRWEAPLPTTPACNAECVGCISRQPRGGAPVTQPRLRFAPTADEIVEVAVDHLERAPRPVVSFGQGCEGEPLLRAEVLRQAIRGIRARTARGVINLNSNGSRPDAVLRLVDAGLDSIRLSINSCRREFYDKYFRPRGYSLTDVVASGKAVASAGGLVSINYFIFPGLTDSEEEFQAFAGVVEQTGARLIQTRNLNLDPDTYLRALDLPQDMPAGFGLTNWIDRVHRAWPHLRLGYFNPPREDWPP